MLKPLKKLGINRKKANTIKVDVRVVAKIDNRQSESRHVYNWDIKDNYSTLVATFDKNPKGLALDSNTCLVADKDILDVS